MDDADFWASKIAYWDSVYGFDMTAVKPLNLVEPVVELVPAESIVSDTCEVKVSLFVPLQPPPVRALPHKSSA